MSSIGSEIAQVNGRTRFLLARASGTAYTTATVQNPTSSNITQAVGSVVTYNTAANAVAQTAGNVIDTTGAYSIAAGDLFRDMGRKVNVFANGVRLYELTLVQRQYTDQAVGSTEGVGGSAGGLYNAEGYNDYYAVTWSANPGTTGIGVVVARV